jgi:hypothetical protein
LGADIASDHDGLFNISNVSPVKMMRSSSVEDSALSSSKYKFMLSYADGTFNEIEAIS